MAYKRRRKQKYTWFPVLGTEFESDSVGVFSDLVGVDFTLISPATGASVTQVYPLTADIPRGEQIDASEPGVLSDIVGQAYFLRRLVGKLFLSMQPESNGLGQIKVAAGFFVARAADIDPDLPVGGVQNATGSGTPEAANLYGPNNSATIREPWIWRRAWMLGNAAQSGEEFFTIGRFPQTNVLNGSSLDGPHIDAKTLRKVSNDDRLYFAISATGWPYGATQSGQINGHLDLRVLAQLRKHTNRGVF